MLLLLLSLLRFFAAAGERPSWTHAAQKRLPGAARARAGARHLLLLLLNVLLLKPRQSGGLAVLACGLAVLSSPLSLITRLRRAPVTVHMKLTVHLKPVTGSAKNTEWDGSRYQFIKSWRAALYFHKRDE
jgi:hypothetical protein